MDQHLLSIILFAPLAGMLVLLLIPSSAKNVIKLWANLAGFVCFLVSLPLVTRFDKSADGYQMVEQADWIPSLGAKYLVGVDGISMLLVMLTTVVSFPGDPLVLERDRRPAERILRHVPAARNGHDRRIPLARFLPVLRVLGAGAGADVLHHRSLGRPAQALRRDQVFPLHADAAPS